MSIASGKSELAEENEYYKRGLSPAVIEALSHDLGGLKGSNIYASVDHGSTWIHLGQARVSQTHPTANEFMMLERSRAPSGCWSGPPMESGKASLVTRVEPGTRAARVALDTHPVGSLFGA